MHDSDHPSLSEEVGRHGDATGRQAVGELGTDACGQVLPEHLAVLADTFLLEHEDLLHGHDVALHADDLAHTDDTARTVRHARQMDDDVECRGDLLAHGNGRQAHAAHHDQG